MTDTLKPLTSAELAAIFDGGIGWCSESTFARIRATIEQQREQIEKLRNGCASALDAMTDGDTVEPDGYLPAIRKCREALAATEPSNG